MFARGYRGLPFMKLAGRSSSRAKKRLKKSVPDCGVS
jgi:hypothetical protein